MDIREQLLAAVGKSHLSERRLSKLATGSSDTIRNIRRGAVPRVDTLEALCGVLGLELQIRPGLIQPYDESAPGPRPPTEFSSKRQLPVYEWADRSTAGYLRQAADSDGAPAPVELLDGHAFYVRMPDESMVPARIWRNHYCLISPSAQLEVDQRGWFRGPTGRETIMWVMRLPAGRYDLGAWDLDEVGHQKPIAVHWTREDVVDRGVVLAVYSEKPATGEVLRPVGDWRPDALAELWRSALFSDEFKEVVAGLDRTVAAVEETEMQIKRQAAMGRISDFQAEQLLRVLDYRLQDSLRDIRSSLTEDLSDAG